jgi:hypothetical protein
VVLGIGEGSIALTLEKLIYAPGEPIRGKAKLTLSEPKKARSLRLDIYRLERRSTARGGSTDQKIVEFTQSLSGEKTYGSGEEFPFEALAPNAVQKLPDNPILSALSFLVPKPRYFVSVSLDMPMAVDISAKVQIQMSEPAQKQQL